MVSQGKLCEGLPSLFWKGSRNWSVPPSPPKASGIFSQVTSLRANIIQIVCNPFTCVVSFLFSPVRKLQVLPLSPR